MKVAQGEYVFFLDADDYIRQDTLEILYNQAQENDLDMLSFSGTNFEHGTNHLTENAYYTFRYLPENFNAECFNYRNCKKFITKMAVSSCLTCYKLKFLRKNNIEFPPHLFFEDNVFFTHAILTAERCGICKEILYFRRVHPEQVTQNLDKHYGDYLQICQKVVDLVFALPISESIREKYLKSYRGSAVSLFKSFSKAYQAEYTDKLQAFLDNNIKTKTRSYKLFDFIPLLSVEEK